MFEDWGFYQFVVGLIALLIIIIIALYERFKNKKAFSYYKTDSLPLISNKIGRETLQVLYNNTSVEDAHIITFYFKNNGIKFIDKEDFILPICISSETKLKILNAVITSTHPQNLIPSFTISDSQIVINPLVLNRGDSFQVNVVSDGEFLNPIILGRIKGVSGFDNLNKKYTRISIKLLYFSLGIIFTQFLIIAIRLIISLIR